MTAGHPGRAGVVAQLEPAGQVIRSGSGCLAYPGERQPSEVQRTLAAVAAIRRASSASDA